MDISASLSDLFLYGFDLDYFIWIINYPYNQKYVIFSQYFMLTILSYEEINEDRLERKHRQ